LILPARILFFSALLAITVLAFLPDYSHLPQIVSLSDLVNHTAAFTVLFILYRLSYGHATVQIVLLLIGYGLFIEAVQSFLPTRSASLTDIVADGVGIILGYMTLKVSGRLPRLRG
jgi:VanZ family protein